MSVICEAKPNASVASLTELPPIETVIVSGSDAKILSRVSNPATTLAIWRRRLDGRLTDVARLIAQEALELVTRLDPFCEEACRRFRQETTSATGRSCAPLNDDLLELSRLYAKASQSRTVQIRLEAVRDDGCRRFHLDNVAMRLIVTYCGPGTQWVSPAFATSARDQQMAYEDPLNSLMAGDVAIFRGKKSGVDNLVLHRSPPLKDYDAARLVAVIDSADA